MYGGSIQFRCNSASVLYKRKKQQRIIHLDFSSVMRMCGEAFWLGHFSIMIGALQRAITPSQYSQPEPIYNSRNIRKQTKNIINSCGWKVVLTHGSFKQHKVPVYFLWAGQKIIIPLLDFQIWRLLKYLWGALYRNHNSELTWTDENIPQPSVEQMDQ